MHRILFFISIYFASALLVYCQNYNVRNYSLEDGLPQTHVYEIAQDKNGFLWFGTQGGVAKFNGIEFITYSQKDGLADNHVTSIYQDDYENMWFGHRFDGVSCLTNGKILSINPDGMNKTISKYTYEKIVLV